MSDRNQSGVRQATQLIQGGRRADWAGAVVNPPVWRASTILYDDVDAFEAGKRTNEDGRWFYGRRGTPTQWALADALTALEPEAAGTMLYPSGVAAITGALLSVLKPGDHLLMVDSAYDPSRALCDLFLARLGISTTYYDPLIGGAIESIIQPNTRAIFLESPGSLTFEIQDIPAIVQVAQSRGLVTIIDNTWATPLLLPAITMGVDLSILSCTKYICGHSDVIMGAVMANAATWPALRITAQMLGQYVSPDDAYLTSRGLRTLDIRLRQHGTAAQEIAQWLASHPQVERVLHPAFADAPQRDIFARDFNGASGLFGFTLNASDPKRVVDALNHFGIGYSWGGFESLAMPVDPAKHRTVTRWDHGTVIRLNIGLEDIRDLIDDLKQALSHA